jgi:hypothetical protein
MDELERPSSGEDPKLDLLARLDDARHGWTHTICPGAILSVLTTAGVSLTPLRQRRKIRPCPATGRSR